MPRPLLSSAAGQLLWCWWTLACYLTLFALIAFPFYKGILLGLFPVAAGALVAVSPKFIPRGWRRYLAAGFSRMVSRKWLLTVALLGFLVRVPLIIFPAIPHSDHRTYYDLGIQLASGLGYGDSILYPPGQPAWLALCIFLLGKNIHVLVFVENLLYVLAILVIYFSIRRHSETAARWGSLIVAFFPSLVIYSGTLGHENTSVFTNVGVMALFLIAASAQGSSKIGNWIVLGLFVGLAAFIRPVFLATPVVLSLVLWIWGKQINLIIRWVLITIAAMAVVISPWVIRNYEMFGQFTLISTNFGSVLLSANAAKSDGIYMNTDPIGAELNPIAQDHYQRRLAIEAIWSHKSVFMQRMVKRLVFMWGTDTSILDFYLGDNPESGITVLRATLSMLIQSAWSWFVVAWVVAATKRPPWRRQHELFEIWCACWIGLVWVLHLIVEPHSRHHLIYIPMLAIVFLPDYWTWVMEESPVRRIGSPSLGKTEFDGAATPTTGT